MHAVACESPAANAAARPAEVEKQVQGSLRELQDGAARALGYRSLNQALEARLKEKGLDLAVPPSQKLMQRLLSTSSRPGEASEYFSGAARCARTRSSIERIYNGQTLNPAEAESVLNDSARFLKEARTSFVEKFAQEPDLFVNTFLARHCESIKQHAGQLNPDAAKAAKTCDKARAIRAEARELWRIRDMPGFKGKSEAFVRQYDLPRVLVGPKLEDLPADRSPEAIAQRLEAASHELGNECLYQNELDWRRAQEVARTLMSEVNTTKIVVEGLADKYYPEKRREQVERMVSETRLDLQEITKGVVKNPATRARVLDEYQGIAVWWLEKPQASAYRQGRNGAQVLDPARFPPPDKGQFLLDTYALFEDAQLTRFATFNAEYLPTRKIGAKEDRERVLFTPAMMASLESNPDQFRMIMAHELGHKLGPEVSRINGHDMAPEYQELLQCLRDPKSIRMQPDQEDEAIADVFAAEVMAGRLSQLPVFKRRQALSAALGPLCDEEETLNEYLEINCRGRHPDPAFRISGILGANPRLREAIGCEGESGKYRSCGLSSSGANGPGARGAPNQATQPPAGPELTKPYRRDGGVK